MKIRKLRKELKRIERKLGNVEVYYGGGYQDVPVHRVIIAEEGKKFAYPLISNDDGGPNP